MYYHSVVSRSGPEVQNALVGSSPVWSASDCSHPVGVVGSNGYFPIVGWVRIQLVLEGVANSYHGSRRSGSGYFGMVPVGVEASPVRQGCDLVVSAVVYHSVVYVVGLH